MINNQEGALVGSNTLQPIKLQGGLGHARGYHVWVDELRLKWDCIVTQHTNTHFPPLWLRLCFDVRGVIHPVSF